MLGPDCYSSTPVRFLRTPFLDLPGALASILWNLFHVHARSLSLIRHSWGRAQHEAHIVPRHQDMPHIPFFPDLIFLGRFSSANHKSPLTLPQWPRSISPIVPQRYPPQPVSLETHVLWEASCHSLLEQERARYSPLLPGKSCWSTHQARKR